ncbi:MAG TPA: RND transporter, partial [Paraburkholderia sp.]
SLLTSERQDVQIHGQQMTLSVSLVKALGGGWEAGADQPGTQQAAQKDAQKDARSGEPGETKQALAPAQ